MVSDEDERRLVEDLGAFDSLEEAADTRIGVSDRGCGDLRVGAALVKGRVGEGEIDPANAGTGQSLPRYRPPQMPQNCSTVVWSMSEDQR